MQRNVSLLSINENLVDLASARNQHFDWKRRVLIGKIFRPMRSRWHSWVIMMFQVWIQELDYLHLVINSMLRLACPGIDSIDTCLFVLGLRWNQVAEVVETCASIDSILLFSRLERRLPDRAQGHRRCPGRWGHPQVLATEGSPHPRRQVEERRRGSRPDVRKQVRNCPCYFFKLGLFFIFINIGLKNAKKESQKSF